MNLLVKRSPIDAPDALEEAWLSSFQAHKALLESDPPTAVIAALDAASASRASPSSNPRPAAPILEAVLFACLTWPLRQAVDLLNRLSGASSRAAVLSCIAIPFSKQFLAGKLCYATDAVRAQTLWLCEDIISSNVQGAEEVVLELLRNCEGGDPSPRNSRFIDGVVKLLQPSRISVWLAAHPTVVPVAFYTWLRLVIDHDDPSLKPLQDLEVAAVMYLWSNFRAGVLSVGRDVVRLFLTYDLKTHPSLREMWLDMVSNGVVSTLLDTKPHRGALISRLPYEVETQLMFVLKNVNTGQHRRYQQWFAQKFFPAKPNDTLLVDLVRYVCCVFHPNNKLLQSQVVPRWFMLGWLVSLCKTPQAAFAFRAALVYDWLGYDDKKSVMYVEPAMLMMMRALPKYTDVVAGVLDALVTVTKGFDGVDQLKARVSINRAFHDCQALGVVKSLAPLTSCELLLPLRTDLSSLFVPFGAAEVSIPPPARPLPVPLTSALPALEVLKPKQESQPAVEPAVGEKRLRGFEGPSEATSPHVITPEALTPLDVPMEAVSEPADAATSVSVTIPSSLAAIEAQLLSLVRSVEAWLQEPVPAGPPSPHRDSAPPATPDRHGIATTLLDIVTNLSVDSASVVQDIGIDLGRVLGRVFLADLVESTWISPRQGSPLHCLFDLYCDSFFGAVSLSRPSRGSTSPGPGSPPPLPQLRSSKSVSATRELLASTLVGIALCSSSDSDDEPDSDHFAFRTVGVRLLAFLLQRWQVGDGVHPDSSLSRSSVAASSSSQPKHASSPTELQPYIEFAKAFGDQTQRPFPVTSPSDSTNDPVAVQLGADIWTCLDMDCMYVGASAGTGKLEQLPSSRLAQLVLNIWCDYFSSAASKAEHVHIWSQLCASVSGSVEILRFLCCNASAVALRKLLRTIQNLPAECSDALALPALRRCSVSPDEVVHLAVETTKWSDKEQMTVWMVIAGEVRLIERVKGQVWSRDLLKGLLAWIEGNHDAAQVAATMVDSVFSDIVTSISL